MKADSTNSMPGDGAAPLNLRDNFPAHTPEDWRSEAEAFLNGADFDKKLKTATPEGIALEPIYFARDVQGLEAMRSFPGASPFLRGGTAAGVHSHPREVGCDAYEALPGPANAFFRESLQRGQSALRIPLDRPSAAGMDADQAEPCAIGCGGVSLCTVRDMSDLLRDLPLAHHSLHIHPGAAALPLAALLLASLEAQGMRPRDLRGGIHQDPLGEALVHGSLPYTLDEGYARMAALTDYCAEALPAIYTMGVSGVPYADAGAGADRELGAVLATGAAYVRALLERGITIDRIAPRISFEFGLGPHFFTEVAKLRAARMLWDRVLDAFGASPQVRRMRQRALSANWNKSALDPHTNLLRTTTEAFSAAIAGVDGMCLHPFDVTVRKPDMRSRRIARNTQIILAEECNLDAVMDPAGGSYYIESLTNALCLRAWAYFQDIERAGGMAQAAADGWISRSVQEAAQARRNDVARGKSALVGVNLHPAHNDESLSPDQGLSTAEAEARAAEVRQSRASAASGLSDSIRSAWADKSVNPLPGLVKAAAAGASLGLMSSALRGAGEDWSVPALDLTRAAVVFEDLRAAAARYAQKNGDRPTIYLANIGPLRNHKMRMDFTRGFFEVGGFSFVVGAGHTDPAQVARDCAASQAPIVVVCGTDADYPDFLPAFLKTLKGSGSGPRVLLAGHPGEREKAYKEAGLDDFIFFKSSIYETNRSCLRHCGAID